MTTPPHRQGPYGQPRDPYGQGGHGRQRPPQQPWYGQPGYGAPYDGANDRTQQFGGAPQTPYGGVPQWPGAGGGHGGTAPPPPPGRNTGMVVAIVAIALLAIAGAGFYFFAKDDAGNDASGETSTTSTADPSGDTATGAESPEGPGEAIDAQPGDCIRVNVASATNADVETVDCATPEALYRVATREETDTGGCPNDQYVSYTEEGLLLLCLQLNVQEGDCLEVSASEDKRADCAAPGATHEVVAVLDGVDDETRCSGNATQVVTYPRPPLTICLGSPTA